MLREEKHPLLFAPAISMINKLARGWWAEVPLDGPLQCFLEAVGHVLVSISAFVQHFLVVFASHQDRSEESCSPLLAPMAKAQI